MLKTCDLIKDVVDVDEKEMLKMVNIPDFTKCIAEFSGITVSKIKDEVIKDYLLLWARNKRHFFKMLGNSLVKDIKFAYDRLKDDIRTDCLNLMKEYPTYALWIKAFENLNKNKIDYVNCLDSAVLSCIETCFPEYRIIGSNITHFFKGCLSAPDDLITKIAAIFENEKISAKYTISIDPVDMMLASENPYKWTSCYRLECNNSSSHADGCLAAILDDTSLISYVWSREGAFTLYDVYKFKKIRYKRMRQWLAISHDWKTIHFNEVYPGKSSYEDSFVKVLREIVEGVVSEYRGFTNKWTSKGVGCDRKYWYGYSEFNAYFTKSLVTDNPQEEYEDIEVFNSLIPCPCGCGDFLPGSDDDEEEEYNGDGFVTENYEHKYWCDCAEDYCTCECCEENCYDCSYWREEHPFCDIDVEEEFVCPTPSYMDCYDGLVSHCKSCCCDCPRYKAYLEEHPEEEEEENEDDN